MEKLYGCDGVIFRTRRAAEEHAKYVYGEHNAFAQIREWYINNAKMKMMTPLEKKKHKMKQRLKKMQEDFE